MSTQTLNPSKKSVLWNIIGSIIASASSFVLLLCVTRAVGTVNGGIFALAYSTAQILLSVGKYGVRSFQATDIQKEISFETYLFSRVWFCTLMFVLCLVFCLFSGYNLEKTLIFVFVCIIKMVDAIEDVFHGQLQCCDKLDVAGQLLAGRNLFTVILFCLMIAITKHLFLTCLVTAVASLLGGILLNTVVTGRYMSCTIAYKKQELWLLVGACFPLFAGSFLSLYIYNACKYALDYFGSEEQITYYSIIFMPAFVINLFSEFIFKPLLTQIAALWSDKKGKEFFCLIGKLLSFILVLTFFAGAGGYVCGAQLLSMVYNVDVILYRIDLVILIISGGFSAGVYLLYNVLTAMRLQKTIIINYGIATVLITILGFVGVRYWAIRGATIAYLFTEIILFVLMFSCTLYGYKKGKI